MPFSPIERAYYEYLSSKPIISTQDLYSSIVTDLCDKQQQCQYLFDAYGSQQQAGQSPFYRTTTSEYGWYTPNPNTVPSRFFPKAQQFSNGLARSGMYRNFSLNM